MVEFPPIEIQVISHEVVWNEVTRDGHVNLTIHVCGDVQVIKIPITEADLEG